MNPMFYFLLAITTVLAATANAVPVLDVEGKAVSGGVYYVRSYSGPPGDGDLTIVNEECPLYIGMSSSVFRKTMPVRFSNWKSRVGFVPESENLHVKMAVLPTACANSTYWWISPSDLPRHSVFVLAGPKPRPGNESPATFFQIKKHELYPGAYKFMFCQDGFKYCNDVEMIPDAGGIISRLIIYLGPPFGPPGKNATPFVFVKAAEEP